VTLPMEIVPKLLGITHAALHKIDPQPLIKSLVAQGVNENTLFLSNRYGWLKEKADQFPWLSTAIDWLLEHQPSEPEQLVICHGDFHPLNILVKDGAVTGVLDWPGFLIADPVLDIANTIVLSTIPFKHLAPMLGLDLAGLNLDGFVESYLVAYQTEQSFDLSKLDYYRVMRCVNALIQGSEGQAVWQHPLIGKDLLDYIHLVTGIEITLPSRNLSHTFRKLETELSHELLADCRNDVSGIGQTKAKIYIPEIPSGFVLDIGGGGEGVLA